MKSKLKSRIGTPAVGSRLLVYCGLAFLAISFLQPLQAQSTITLSPLTSPASGQPGVTTIAVIGSNFPSGTIVPSAITVTIQPAVANAGPTATTPAAAVTTIVGSTRRVTFTIPSSIVVSSPAAYLVSISGTTSTNTSFASANQASLRVNPPASISSLSPNTGQAGQTVTVTVTGSFTNFLQGATQASFGAGISVGGGPVGGSGPVTVTSPTSATAQLVISPSAPTGPQTVLVATGVQQASLAAGFTMLPPDPSTVAPPLDTSVTTTIGSSTAFLYSGARPIQTGVAPNAIVPTRAAVLRGKVLDKTNAPLPGVTITVLNHPEFGQTLSRADGMFDLAVNGGGPLTLTYSKTGFLAAQRQVQVPWQDFAFTPDVILLSQDTRVTAVDLTSSAPMQVARGSAVTDSDGTRQATLLVPHGTQATMVMSDGRTQPLTTLSVRATEFTVGPNGPQAMPAELPPTSAYTYAVMLTADEAKAAGAIDVRFSPSLPFYIENFLHFPVGTALPLGAYDPTQGVWVPADNGLVLQILSITGGRADLDLDGSGQPASAVALAALGVTDAERQQLAGLYGAGQSVWRVMITHFDKPWDANMGVGCAADCRPYNGPGPMGPDERDDACRTAGSSIIESQNQALGETIRVTGTPFSLHYQSDRVPGRKDAYTLIIPLSGASIPKSLKAIKLVITVAGQIIDFGPQTPGINLTKHFTWDGKDFYGRQTQGLQPVGVRIGYVYGAVYTAAAAAAARAFGRGGGNSIAIGREDITFWTQFHTYLGKWDESPQGLGGWSLSVHHGYDVGGKALYLGDGSRRSTNDKALSATITTAAGNGVFQGFGGDGGPATAAGLNLSPCFSGLAVGPDGSLYIADTGNERVRRVGPDGVITTFAGTTPGFSGDGGPATAAALVGPKGLALGPDGSLYIADTGNGRIRRVGPDGLITTFAGTGAPDFGGDGGPATAAALHFPVGLALGPDGSLYIGDEINERIRRVGPDGIITTFAGTGTTGFSGDGGPATAASLRLHCSGLTVGPDGSLYIADTFNARVRRVGPDGTITTFAGTGAIGSSTGDGGPATAAIIAFPSGLALGPDGSLYITDSGPPSGQVRRVGPEGIISTVAGHNNGAGFSGDGGPATAAALLDPFALAIGPDGGLYIADDGNERVRKVVSLPGFQLADILIASEDGSEVYVFNGAGLHKRTLNALTGATRYAFSYDSKQHLATVTDGDGNVTTIEHDANGNPTAIVSPFGQRTTLGVDANGYLASVTDPAGNTFKMTYFSGGLLQTFQDPNGNTSTMAYDTLGRLQKDTDAAGGFKALARTDADRSYTVSLTTTLNRTTKYQIDNLTTGDERRVNSFCNGTQAELLLGNDGSRKTTLADGTVINLVQGPDPRWSMEAPLAKSLSTTRGGLTFTLTTARTANLADTSNVLSLTKLTDTIMVNGRTFTNSFDAASKTFTKTSAAGRKSTTTIDTQGRVSQMQVSGLLAANLTYDSHGRMAAITQGTGIDTRTANFSYNSDGYLQSATDPLGRPLSFQYDAAGHVIQSILPDGRKVFYHYDATGNLISLAPPGRPTHNFNYTPLNLTSQYAPPSVSGTGNTVYTYNADQQLTLVTRPDNKTVRFAYDCSGRLSTTSIARGAYTYFYDATTGHPSSITAPDGGRLAFSYDGALLTNVGWSGTVTGVVTQTYDNDFRVTSLSVNGTPINFSYDADSLLIQAGSLILTRDPQRNGLLTGTALGNESETLSYNGFGELTGASASSSGTTLLAEQYTRDQLGRIIQRVETIGGITTTVDYKYDPADRLIEVKQNGTTAATYSYDTNSNRTSANQVGVITNGAYDDQDRLTQYGDTNYSYTANGELQSKTVKGQTTTYHHDELGNLLGVTLPHGTIIEYVIDGRNRRIGKKVGGNLVKGFLYQDRLKPIAELDGNSNVISRFVYGSRSNVPDYMVKNGTTYRVVTDQLGSPRLVVDVATGTIAQQMDYDEFGRVVHDTNPAFQPFGFAGGLYDPDTKLVRFGARDYDAETGRWEKKDPIRFKGADMNLYEYVFNDPINLTDLTGLDWKDWKQWTVSRILALIMKYKDADTPEAADKPDPSEQQPPPKPPSPPEGGKPGEEGGKEEQSCDPENLQNLFSWDPRNPFSPLNPFSVVYGGTGHPPPIPEMLKPFQPPGHYTPIGPLPEGPLLPIEPLLEGAP